MVLMVRGNINILAAMAATEPVTSWFDAHFVLTDGTFGADKSAAEKRFMTVTNLETLYEHFTFHALSVGAPVPSKLTFAFTLQTTRGVRFKFVKNKWVGAIKRAANVCPRQIGRAHV